MTEYVNLVDPWKKAQAETRRRWLHRLLGEKPPHWYELFPPFLLSVLLLAGGRVGLVVGAGDPIWLSIPSIPPLSIALLVYGLIQGIRVWGHQLLWYIRLGREASET